MEEQPSEPAGTLWPPASTTLGCVLVERSFPTRKRVRAASPALPSPDDHALPCSTLDTAIGGWKSMKDEHVYIATMLANTEAQPDTRAEFVALVRVLRGLDSLRCRSPDDTVIPQKDLQAALKKEGVHVGCYQLIHMLRLAQREHGALGAGTAVDIDELWKMYAALPRAARVNRKLFRERWEGSLLLHKSTKSAADDMDRSASADFVAGSMAGVAATVVGHPFDTIKVRLQTRPDEFKGVAECLSQTVRKEGIRGLYKGMASPLITVPLVNAVVFASYGQAKWFFERRIRKEAERTGETERELTVYEIMSAGAFAGFVNSVVVGPVELVKCRLQAATTTDVGSWNCAKEIYGTAGLKGLCRGMIATIAREVPSYVGQFGTYEYLKIKLTPEGEQTKDLSPLRTMVAGGCAGTVCWFVSYPMDIVKSLIQLQPYDRPRRFPNSRFFPDGGIISCSRHIWKTDGFMGFWRGLSPCLLRAFPANGAGFLAYELSWRVLDMLKLT